MGASIWVDRRANVPHTAPSDVDQVHAWVLGVSRSGQSPWPHDSFDVQGGLSVYATVMFSIHAREFFHAARERLTR